MFSCRGTCAPRDPATDTVKIRLSPVVSEQAEEAAPHVEEREAAQADERQQEEQEQARRREEEAERLRLEEQSRREREEMEEREQLAREEAEERARREREEAEERRRRREQEEAEERARRAQEEALRAEAARREEAERLVREEERRVLVKSFLKDHGYSAVGAPKRTMLKTKYPIHTAAKTGDPAIVAALLESGADPAQRNSAGKTAAQVAQQLNKNGSHNKVIRTLGGA